MVVVPVMLGRTQLQFARFYATNKETQFQLAVIFILPAESHNKMKI
jgi:hypothetical protein